MKTKKPYRKPKLTTHGDVSKITFGPRGGEFDGLFGDTGGLES